MPLPTYPQGLARGLNQIEKNLATGVKKKRMTSFEMDMTMSKIVGVTAENDQWKKELAKADVVLWKCVSMIVLV